MKGIVRPLKTPVIGVENARLMRTVLALVLLSTSLAARAIDAVDTAALFTKHCASCHGKDGKATTPIAKRLGVKDLSESKIPDTEIKKQILDGRLGPDGKPVMPPFKAKLKESEVDPLVDFVKRFRK